MKITRSIKIKLDEEDGKITGSDLLRMFSGDELINADFIYVVSDLNMPLGYIKNKNIGPDYEMMWYR